MFLPNSPFLFSPIHVNSTYLISFSSFHFFQQTWNFVLSLKPFLFLQKHFLYPSFSNLLTKYKVCTYYFSILLKIYFKSLNNISNFQIQLSRIELYLRVSIEVTCRNISSSIDSKIFIFLYIFLTRFVIFENNFVLILVLIL